MNKQATATTSQGFKGQLESVKESLADLELALARLPQDDWTDEQLAAFVGQRLQTAHRALVETYYTATGLRAAMGLQPTHDR